MREYLADLVSGAPQLRKLYRACFSEKQERIESAELAAQKRIHPLVLEKLSNLNRGRSEKIERNLQLLEKSPVCVAVSGQQIGLFGGPLLTLYKALSVIKFAEQISAESGIPCVPIFWMQSEDHDFAEIAKATFFAADESLLDIELDAQRFSLGDSVGKLTIDTVSAALLAQGLEKLGDVNAAVKADLLNAYQAGKTLTQAFAEFMHSLLAEYGLLLFDPNDADLKTLYKELIVSGFLRTASIGRLLDARVQELRAMGYPIQVPLKENSPLWFISNNGQRERLVEESDGKFASKGTKLEKEALYNLIEKSPQVFSSSALIRPIFQDTIFPSVAYIAGDAEVSYWAQITPLYEFFNCLQPMVVPRARFRLLDAKSQKLMQKLDLSDSELSLSAQEYVNRSLASSELSSQKLFSAAQTTLLGALSNLQAAFEHVDRNLVKPLKQTQESFEGSLSRLRARYEKALLERENVTARQFERVKSALRPRDQEQERVICQAHFLLKYGKPLISKLYQELDVMKGFELKKLKLEGSYE